MVSHIRFGRMERRREEARHQLLIDELNGAGVPLTAEFQRKYLQGADELELVRSGLDDTMREAYQRMREVWRERTDVPDLRIAGYLCAIEKVAKSYRALGI